MLARPKSSDLPGTAPVTVVSDPLSEGSSVRDHGFSLKIRDADAARLFFRQVRDQRRRGGPLAQKSPARPTPRNARPMVQQRKPLVSFDDVLSAFGVALAHAGKTPEQARGWPPIILQDRISRTNDWGSTAPERQIANMAEWCVDHQFRPVHLVHEEVSGSIYRRRRRWRFEQFLDDLLHGRIVDPETCKPVRATACFLLDRFTRDPEEGGDSLRVFRKVGVDLHETYYRADPKPLHQVEHEIRDAWNRASKEVERTRERIMDAFLRKARRGEPSYGTPEMFGHEPVVNPVTGKTVGYRAIPDQAAVIRTLVDLVVLHGGNIHSATCWLNDNGQTTVGGGRWYYREVQRLLRAPRLAGLVRLRTDRTRLHEPSYLGELFPDELIYEEGEQPAAGFEPPIEPIIPYPLWAKLQDTLDSHAVKHGPRVRYFASNNVLCGTCGKGITGGKVSKRVPQYRCPKRHLHGRSRSTHNRTLASADGKRHPTMRVDQLDYVLSEVIFAAVDRDLDPALAEEDDLREAEQETERRAIAALDQRLGDVSYMLARGRITRPDYDALAEEIETERVEHRARLRKLQAERPQKELPEGMTMRELWPNLTVDEQREWFEVVFEQVVLQPASNLGAQNIATRLEFTFRKGYQPSPDELEQLLISIEEEVRLGTRRDRVPEEIIDRIVEMAQQGIGLKEIGDALRSEGIEGPRGGRKWTIGRVSYALKRACRDRGIPYPRPADRCRIPLETRLLVVALAKKMPSYQAVADELNKLKVERPNGREWTGHAVREVLTVQERQSGTARPLSPVSIRRGGRQSHLPSAIREQLWTMHRREGRSLREIADWLEGSGIRTAHGNTKWNPATILYIVRGVDDNRPPGDDTPEERDAEAA